MINWQEIDTVLLDMDGTLLDLHFDNYFWREHIPLHYAKIHKLDLSETYKQLQIQFRQHQGTIQWYCTQYWAKQLELNIVQLKQDMSHKIALRENALDFLKALQQSNKSVALVTNAHRKSYDIKMQKIDLSSYFDTVISAHDYGIPKEDMTFWQQLQTDHAFTPERTLLIDDNETVLRTAQHYGIKYLLAPAQPDSTQAPRTQLQFTALDNYSDLLPI